MPDEDFNFLNLVGEKELNAYQNYIKLTSYRNFVLELEKEEKIQNDYGVRDLTFPMDFCYKDI
jgi:hypothetical protein